MLQQALSLSGYATVKELCPGNRCPAYSPKQGNPVTHLLFFSTDTAFLTTERKSCDKQIILLYNKASSKDRNRKGAEDLKIKLESAELPETEIIIRGDVTGEEVVSLLQLLKKRNSGKLILYKEEEQYIVDADEIVYIEVSGSKVYAYTKQDTYEAKQKLYEIRELLGTRAFVQINKSVIVNINCVKSIQAEFSGNYRCRLKNRKESLTISRKYFKEFKDRI